MDGVYEKVRLPAILVFLSSQAPSPQPTRKPSAVNPSPWRPTLKWCLTPTSVVTVRNRPLWPVSVGSVIPPRGLAGCDTISLTFPSPSPATAVPGGRATVG